jgi:predicted unusual protein kinase regulating ubiquinone biosynthesis (AarF/ABC1/UbiB family)
LSGGKAASTSSSSTTSTGAAALAWRRHFASSSTPPQLGGGAGSLLARAAAAGRASSSSSSSWPLLPLPARAALRPRPRAPKLPYGGGGRRPYLSGTAPPPPLGAAAPSAGGWWSAASAPARRAVVLAAAPVALAAALLLWLPRAHAYDARRAAAAGGEPPYGGGARQRKAASAAAAEHEEEEEQAADPRAPATPAALPGLALAARSQRWWRAHALPPLQRAWLAAADEARTLLRGLYLAALFCPAVLSAPCLAMLGWGGPQGRAQWVELVRWTLERAGPAFIKWGQWAATRPDLFPPDVCESLARLQSGAPEHPPEQTVAAVERAFGRPLEELFDSFEPRPVASGSIAQVHRATLSARAAEACGVPPGTVVAVKVRHPRAPELMARDFELMRRAARLSAKLPGLSDLRLDESVRQFGLPLREQLDLSVEAASLARFAHNFRRWRRVRFPAPHYPLVSPEVLVESFEEGALMNGLVRASADTRAEVAAERLRRIERERRRRRLGPGPASAVMAAAAVAASADEERACDDAAALLGWGGGGEGGRGAAAVVVAARKAAAVAAAGGEDGKQAMVRTAPPTVAAAAARAAAAAAALHRAEQASEAAAVADANAAAAAATASAHQQQQQHQQGRRGTQQRQDDGGGSGLLGASSDADDDGHLLGAAATAATAAAKAAATRLTAAQDDVAAARSAHAEAEAASSAARAAAPAAAALSSSPSTPDPPSSPTTSPASVLRAVAAAAAARVRESVAETGLRAYLQMLLADNFVHADMHPGNILVRELDNAYGWMLALPGCAALLSLARSAWDALPIKPPAWLEAATTPQLVLLDTGMTAELARGDQQSIVAFFRALSRQDGTGIAKAVLDMSDKEARPCRDPVAFERDLRAMFDSMDAETLRVYSAQVFRDVVDTIRQHGVVLRSAVSAVVVTTLVLEGWSSQLHPDLRVLDAVRDLLASDWRERVGKAVDGVMLGSGGIAV